MMEASKKIEPTSEWNELEYLPWREFRKMAPAILRLEARQLHRLQGQVCQIPSLNLVLAQSIVQLNALAEKIEQAGRPEAEAFLASLDRALLALSLPPEPWPEALSRPVARVVDHLHHLQKRLHLLYE